jgi:RHS repeat-associated protein
VAQRESTKNRKIKPRKIGEVFYVLRILKSKLQLHFFGRMLPTQQGIYATPEFTGDPYPSSVIAPVEENQEPPEGWPRNPIFNAPGYVPGPPVQFGPPIEPTTVKPGEGFTGIGLPENDIFYFHPDHLGSTSYITTKNGSISQHVEYIAYGEVLFEEHSSSFSSPYLFNGKELDRETNLSYFGARYYDAKTSLWLNVDPMSDHPNQIDKSAYSAFWGNPITYTDPDGRCPKCEDEIYLELANHAYEAKRGDISPNGWQAIRVDENKKTGYKGVLYQGFNETNEKQYIYATQGTNPGSGDDWENNIQQAVMGNSSQYKKSVEIAKDLASNYEGISFTGHSLGGGLASANALATKGKAVTFNAAGLSKKTKTNLGLDGKKANISAYVVQGEIVSHLQGKIGLRAEGRITTLPASYIMQIPYLKTDDQIRTAQRISNHLMGPVMEKFKELKR